MEITKQDIDTTSISTLSIEQLVTQAIESCSEPLVIQSKHELISRGKDNIHTRILIKKCCKSFISSIESLLKKADEANSSSDITKSLKGKFLTSISILDRLQLEWQKHDLSIKP